MGEPSRALDELAVLVPPPRRPMLGEWTWDQLHQALGTRLPADYRALMGLYGAGVWSGELGFHDPLDPRGVAYEAQDWADTYRELREDFPELQPLAAYPEPGTITEVLLAWLKGELDVPGAARPHCHLGPVRVLPIVGDAMMSQRGRARKPLVAPAPP